MTAGSALVPLTLVPVEVFGCDDCCLHSPPPYSSRLAQDGECESAGYGLSDAVSGWSDCNRAVGKVYRVEDLDGATREQGETVQVYVRPEDLPFFEKVFGER